MGAAAASEVSDVRSPERHRDHERGRRILQHVAQDVALAQVADLVREHRFEFAVVVRELHELVGQHDDARGQGERVGAHAPALADSSR